MKKRESQLRINGNWEPKMFLKRRGDGVYSDIDDLWQNIHSDEYIEHLLECGINVSHIHFHKGYGLEGEAESIREAVAWAEKLHTAGLKVGVYIGSTFFTEIFRHSDYDDMVVKNDAVGWNAAQYFRKDWCYNSPKSVDYFKQVVRVAIEEVRADILHFDTAFANKLHQACHCEYCLEKFRQFVTEQIPEIADIAGLPEPALLNPPPVGNLAYLANIDELREPGIIAWTKFHAQAGYNALKIFCDYARSLKPDILIFFNGCTLAGNTRYSRPDMALEKLAMVDMTCTEDSNENPVHTTSSGMPVARFRAYKAGFRVKTATCYYTVTNGENNRLMLAEAAAFNYNSLGFVDIAMQHNHHLSEPEDIKFIHHLIKHEKSFTGQQHWHNIALLRHHDTLLLNQFPCNVTPYVVEQALFEAHLPFSIINSTDISYEQLKVFDLLILPDCKSLSDRELAEVEQFVNAGGRLLAIGNSGTTTEFNQFRKHWGLSRIFNRQQSPYQTVIKYDEIAVSTAETQTEQKDITTISARFGKGKAVYMPALQFRLPDADKLNSFGGYPWYYHPYWEPADNNALLLTSIDELLDDRMKIETDLPRHIGVEYFTTFSGSYRIHLVNYKYSPHQGAVDSDAAATVLGTVIIHNLFAGGEKFKVSYLTEQEEFSTTIISHNRSLAIPLPHFRLMATIEFTPA